MQKLKIASTSPLFRIEFLERTLKVVKLMHKGGQNFDIDPERVSGYFKGEDITFPLQIWVPSKAVWMRDQGDLDEVESYVLEWARRLKKKAYPWKGHGYFIK